MAAAAVCALPGAVVVPPSRRWWSAPEHHHHRAAAGKKCGAFRSQQQCFRSSRRSCVAAAAAASGTELHVEEGEDEDEDEDEASLVMGEEVVADWCARARARAIRAVRERDLPVASLLADDVDAERRRKMKRRKKKKKKKKNAALAGDGKADLKGSSQRGSSALEEEEERVRRITQNPLVKKALDSGAGELSGLGSYWKNLGATKIRLTGATGLAESEEGLQKGVSFHRPNSGGSRGHAPTSRQRNQEDFDLNRKLIGAADANEVLSVVDDALEDGLWGRDESPLSAFNVSSALHRIAKHMETESMPKSDRLAFARRKVMAQLVGAAIELLPKCSAQGISNIAWALSKVGGHALYWTEMDRLAEAAMAKMSRLEPQHVANIAGALASMQHSVPPLFEALDGRASFYHRDFRSQELAQFLWAFAALNQPATLLLDSLDSECPEGPSRISVMQKIELEEDDYSSDSFLTEGELDVPDYGDKSSDVKSRVNSDTRLKASIRTKGVPAKWVSAKEWFEDCSLSQLASLSWSYTVLGQLERPSFALVWQAILSHGLGLTKQLTDLPSPRLQTSQLYQTNLSLQLEFPHLGLSLGQPLESLVAKEWENTKSGLKLTSVGQLDVERLLVGTGHKWVAEYVAVDYSLDAALVEKKIGLEFDGPSHFARNTGTPLGHTMLKRRQLAAAGWTLLSIPFHEWDELQGEKEQKFYLDGVLKQCL